MRRVIPILALICVLAACQPMPEGVTPFDCPFTLPEGTPARQVTCYHISMPTRHAEPDGPTIEVAAAVIAAKGLVPEGAPLVVVEGGPGGSALTSLAPVFALPDLDFLRQGRDVVIVEQRGTYHSRPALDCPTTPPPGIGTMDDEDTLDAYKACRADLLATGVDIDAFNSVENAADIPAVVEALGYEGYHFMGLSYGTMLAQHLMRDHPAGLQSVVLDSTAPLETSFLSELALSAERGFTHFFDACAADAYCAATHPDLEATFWAAVERYDADPATLTLAGDGDPLTVTVDGPFIAAFLFESLYDVELIPYVPGYIAALAEGNTLWIETHGYDRLTEPTFSEGMFYTTLCAEDAGFTRQPADLHPALDVAISSEWASFEQLCAVWDVEGLPEVVNQPVTSEIPVLLLAGAFDPITPPHFAEEVAATLANSTLVTLGGASHGAVGGGACPLTLLAAFLDDPTTPLDTSCAADTTLTFSPPLALYTLTERSVGEYTLLVPESWVETQPGTFAPEPAPDSREMTFTTRPDANPQRAAREFITGLEPDGWQKFDTDGTWHIFLAQFGGDLMIVSAAAQGETTLIVTFIAPEAIVGNLADVVYFPAVSGLTEGE